METDPKVRTVFETARALENSPRHASTHAAGVVISHDRLTSHVPLFKGAKSTDEVVTQFPMGDVEKIGLVKFDFLGLKTLTMIAHAERLINASGASTDQFSIGVIPLDDAETFALLSSGKTAGVFQLESPGMRDLLVGLRPDRFEEIIAIIALYRPGPMDLIGDFIKRKQGKIPITYEVPALQELPHRHRAMRARRPRRRRIDRRQRATRGDMAGARGQFRARYNAADHQRLVRRRDPGGSRSRDAGPGVRADTERRVVDVAAGATDRRAAVRRSRRTGVVLGRRCSCILLALLGFMLPSVMNIERTEANGVTATL